jgi:hypothetical protein
MSVLFCKSLGAFAVGAVLMLVLSFTVYRKSYYYKKAEAEMLGIAEKPRILSRLVTAIILLAMILFFAFLSVFNLLLAALLSLFDALFIDYLLLVAWRPALLRLPEGQLTRDSMLRHIKLQFTAGWLFKMLIALLAAAFSIVLGAGSS